MIEKEVTAGVTKEETRKKKNEALIMYKKGKKLVEIAQILGSRTGRSGGGSVRMGGMANARKEKPNVRK